MFWLWRVCRLTEMGQYFGVCARCAHHVLVVASLTASWKWVDILQCVLDVRSISLFCECDGNVTNGLLVLLYSVVCTRCAQHFPVVASLTEIEPMDCLCFLILTSDGWRLAAGSWRLAASGWRLTAGGDP
jgi:predicted nucleic acid-binding Zn ribbon protein